ncbi:hypothetical protein OsJ_23012 [Oryza sativa Japonica Group]|uniref:Uncharacterized protein n=1 Tax=Oryza sativa subsp. japonica TaxID=39947 RepID=A3BGD3_ORYSJ|nr:hypothetical protein OsJ_23012 [Oryza sativa Japonica Group]
MALLRAAARARVRRLVGSGPPALATFAGADRATGGRGGAAGERALQAMRLCCATPSVASVGRDVKAPVSPPAGASVTLVVEQATRFATATTALPLPLAKIPAAGRGGGPRSAGILVATVAVGSKGAHFATASAPERALLTLERAQQATSPCPPLAAPRILCRGLSLSTVAGDKKAPALFEHQQRRAFMEDLMKRASTQILRAGGFYNANTTVGFIIAVLLCFAIILGVLLFMSVLFAEWRAKQFLHSEECDRLTDGMMDKAEMKTQEFLRNNNFHQIVEGYVSEGLELATGEEVRAIRKRFLKEALQDTGEYIVHKTTFGSQRDKIASWFRRDKQQEAPSPSATALTKDSESTVGVVEKVRMRDRVAAWFRRNKETKPAEPAPSQQQKIAGTEGSGTPPPPQ